MEITRPAAIFERQTEFYYEHLFIICTDILLTFLEDEEKVAWINNVEPGRLLDALRLTIGLTPEAKALMAGKRYRSEHATLITRWLKLISNKSAKSMTTHSPRSAIAILQPQSDGTPARTMSEVVAIIKEAKDMKAINQEANDILRTFVVKLPEYEGKPIADNPLDDFLNYLFDTPTSKLADKFQRAKQALENKDMALRVLKAVHLSVLAINETPLTGPLVESYFQICSASPKTRKRKIEDMLTIAPVALPVVSMEQPETKTTLIDTDYNTPPFSLPSSMVLSVADSMNLTTVNNNSTLHNLGESSSHEVGGNDNNSHHTVESTATSLPTITTTTSTAPSSTSLSNLTLSELATTETNPMFVFASQIEQYHTSSTSTGITNPLENCGLPDGLLGSSLTVSDSLHHMIAMGEMKHEAI